MNASCISALILAGGRATRMGGMPKHEILVDGETILARQRRVLCDFAEILVSSPVDIAGVHTVRDEHEGIGPLAGIAAGLAAATGRWLFVIAGDMPNPSAALIGHMVELVDSAGRDAPRAGWENVHAIGVRRNGLPEPLFCMLRIAPAREAARAMIEARDHKASRLLDALGVVYVRDEILAQVNADHALANLNEPRDIPGRD